MTIFLIFKQFQHVLAILSLFVEIFELIKFIHLGRLQLK